MIFGKPSQEEMQARYRAMAERSVLRNGELPTAAAGTQQVIYGQNQNSLGLNYGDVAPAIYEVNGRKFIRNPHGSGDYEYRERTGAYHAPGDGGILMLSVPRAQDGKVEQMGDGSDPYQTGSGTGPYNGADKPNLYNDTNYSRYTDGHADLLENYKANWANKGMSKAEFGKMHWNSAGKSEGRTMPGIEQATKSSSGGSGGSSGGSDGGSDGGKTPPKKTAEKPKVSYQRPNKKVLGHKTNQSTILGSTYGDMANWEPETVGQEKNSLVNSGNWMIKLDPSHSLAADPGQLKWKKPILLSTV